MRKSLKKSIPLLLVLSIVVSCIFCTNVFAATQAKYLNVPIVAQGNTNWCWASSIASIVDYLDGTSFTAANVVNSVIAVSGNQFVSTQGGTQYNICMGYAAYGHSCSSLSRSLTFSEVKSKIDSGIPVQALLLSSNGSGHSVVVRGYTDTGYSKSYSIMV